MVFPLTDENGIRYSSCPFCGYEFPKKEKSEIEQAKATLEKIEGFVLEYDSPDDCNSYQELLAYAERKGYKKGWAWHQAKMRGMIR